MQITSLYRHPVKGFSAERLASVVLEPGCAIPGDRRFAIVHANSRFDPLSPRWVHRRNFVVRAHSPGIAALTTLFNPDTRILTVQIADRYSELEVDSPAVNNELTALLQPFSSEKQPGPFMLVELSAASLTDSPDESVSLLNTRSLKDLEDKTSLSLQRARFRGNLWYEGKEPWEERALVGKTLVIGNVQLEVTEEIVRCAAINVNPEKGGYDLDLLTRLGRMYGHVHFGVLARVLNRGRITQGDEVALAAGNQFSALGI